MVAFANPTTTTTTNVKLEELTPLPPAPKLDPVTNLGPQSAPSNSSTEIQPTEVIVTEKIP